MYTLVCSTQLTPRRAAARTFEPYGSERTDGTVGAQYAAACGLADAACGSTAGLPAASGRCDVGTLLKISLQQKLANCTVIQFYGKWSPGENTEQNCSSGLL